MLCDNVFLVTCGSSETLFSLGTMVSFTNETDHHNITEILLKMTLNTITLTLNPKKAFDINVFDNYSYLYQWRSLGLSTSEAIRRPQRGKKMLGGGSGN